MIANKNDHDFISVVDLKNNKSSNEGGNTTDVRANERNKLKCESP